MTGERSEGKSPDPQLRVKELKREYARLAEVLKEARVVRRRLAALIQTLDGELANSRSSDLPDRVRKVAALQSTTIAEAAAVILGQSGPMRLADLMSELQEAGKLRRSEWAYSTLFTTLTRDERFVRVPQKRGVWRLRR
ncbi:MAG TPA: hypothetical protein VMV09_04230 [Candidatus Saccharimonadales bacterium]|nr:hypothetical protein [Candidatus Saccharimonadales bacterium]